MNCKPGQRAQIVRKTMFHDCVGRKIGAIVTTVEIVHGSSILAMIVEAMEGPVWRITPKLTCPMGQPDCGFDLVPDSCLKPLPDPDDVANVDRLNEILLTGKIKIVKITEET